MKFRDFLNEEYLNEGYPKELFNDIKDYAKDIAKLFALCGCDVKNAIFNKLGIEKASAQSTIFRTFKIDKSDPDNFYLDDDRLFCIMIHKSGGCSAHACEWDKNGTVNSLAKLEFGDCSGKIVRCWSTKVNEINVNNLRNLKAERLRNILSVDPLISKNSNLKSLMDKRAKESSFAKEVRSMCKRIGIKTTGNPDFGFACFPAYTDRDDVYSVRIGMSYALNNQKLLMRVSRFDDTTRINSDQLGRNIQVYCDFTDQGGYLKTFSFEDVANWGEIVKKFLALKEFIEKHTYADMLSLE